MVSWPVQCPMTSQPKYLMLSILVSNANIFMKEQENERWKFLSFASSSHKSYQILNEDFMKVHLSHFVMIF